MNIWLYSAVIVLILIALYVIKFNLDLGFTENFTAPYSFDNRDWAPYFNYSDYWNYLYPRHIYQSNLRRDQHNFGKPMYISLFQVIDASYQRKIS